MIPLPSRSIFSEERHFGEHDAAVKVLRLRALELMQKVANAKKHASPTTQERYLQEARTLQRAAAFLASLESPTGRRKARTLKMALSA